MRCIDVFFFNTVHMYNPIRRVHINCMVRYSLRWWAYFIVCICQGGSNRWISYKWSHLNLFLHPPPPHASAIFSCILNWRLLIGLLMIKVKFGRLRRGERTRFLTSKLTTGEDWYAYASLFYPPRYMHIFS